jgi:site-specific recombinase XerD
MEELMTSVEHILEKSFLEKAKVDVSVGFRNYETWLSYQPLSKHTRRSYISQVYQFLLFLNQSQNQNLALPVDRANCERLIQNYTLFRHSTQFRGNSINTSLVAIKNFFKFLGVGSLTLVREKNTLIESRVLTPEERSRLISVLADVVSSKDAAVVSLLLYTGIRLWECAALNVEDVDLADHAGRLLVRDRKGNVRRNIELNEYDRNALSIWLQQRRTTSLKDKEALFLNRDGSRISTGGLDLIVRKIGIRAHLVLSARVLRRTYLEQACETSRIACRTANSMCAT